MPRSSRRRKSDLKDAIKLFMRLNHEQHGGCGFAPMTMYRLMHQDNPWDKKSTSIVQALHFRTQKDKTALMIWRAGLPHEKRNKTDRINAMAMKNAMRREALYFLVDEHGYLKERRCEDNPQICNDILSGFVEPDTSSNTHLEYRAARLPPVPVAKLRAHARFARSLKVGW